MPINLKRALGGVLFSMLTMTGALCQTSALEAETKACQNDAMQLCGPYIPDHAKIHACLLTYRAQLSPACHAIVAPHHRHHRRPA